MRLSTLVLCCVMILCCTGLFGGTAQWLGIRSGTTAALCPLLAAVGAFSVTPLPMLQVNIGFCLLLVLCVLLCGDGLMLSLSLLLAACAGASGFVFCRLAPNFYEQGLLIALPTAVAAALLLPNRRAGLLCTAAAPMFYAACVLLEGYYLFQTILLDLSAVEVFDAQTMGCALLFLFWRLLPKRQRPARTQTVSDG